MRFGLILPVSRRFKVRIKISNIANINLEVPQGSILGSLLFLLNINMFQAADFDLLLYAAVSCLVYQKRNVKELEQKLNKNFLNFLNVCDR